MGDLRPDLDALLEQLQRSFAADSEIDLVTEEHAEVLAMIRGFGMRLALAGISPTAFSVVSEGLLAALAVFRIRLSSAAGQSVAALCAEGYASGLRDQVHQQHQQELIDAWLPVEIFPKIVLWVVSGPVDPDRMSEAVDGFGRFLLKREAVGAVVHAAGARCASPAAARALLACEETARIVGVQCVFAALEEAVVSAAARAGYDVGILQTSSDIASALQTIMPLSGLTVRSQSWIPGILRGPAGGR